MIHKVKPPTTLKLVHSSKQAKNDLSGQSGEAFSKDQPKKDDSASQKESPQATPPKAIEPATKSENAPIDQQVGLTKVVKEWIEGGKGGRGSISRYKLSLKYQGESAPAKGMLLNKKIS